MERTGAPIYRSSSAREGSSYGANRLARGYARFPIRPQLGTRAERCEGLERTPVTSRFCSRTIDANTTSVFVSGWPRAVSPLQRRRSVVLFRAWRSTSGRSGGQLRRSLMRRAKTARDRSVARFCRDGEKNRTLEGDNSLESPILRLRFQALRQRGAFASRQSDSVSGSTHC